ncbi:hypothetical protein TRVL_02345 [Trypanosoma vivax]|nr:hypothetical protein TRVL_02345 [Trypanosoma vivax]
MGCRPRLWGFKTNIPVVRSWGRTVLVKSALVPPNGMQRRSSDNEHGGNTSGIQMKELPVVRGKGPGLKIQPQQNWMKKGVPVVRMLPFAYKGGARKLSFHLPCPLKGFWTVLMETTFPSLRIENAPCPLKTDR